MFKTAALLAVLTVTPVNPKEPVPVETITITREVAPKPVQAAVAQQVRIEELEQTVYQYQMALYDARTKMCA